MSERDLKSRRCVPCEGGTPPLNADQIQALLPRLRRWSTRDLLKLEKRFEWENFLEAMTFIQKMAALAESEGHHPDFCVHYNVVDVQLWTHAVGGLTENDFILAAKIDELSVGA